VAFLLPAHDRRDVRGGGKLVGSTSPLLPSKRLPPVKSVVDDADAGLHADALFALPVVVSAAVELLRPFGAALVISLRRAAFETLGSRASDGEGIHRSPPDRGVLEEQP